MLSAFSLKHLLACGNFNRYDVMVSDIYECTFSESNLRNGVHTHDCYEACIVTEGMGYFQCGDITYPLEEDCLFLASPNVSHEILCEEGGLLRLWFFTFVITASDSRAELTEGDKIIDDFVRRHSAVAHRCGFLGSYAAFRSSYALKNGAYGVKAMAIVMLLDCMQQLTSGGVRDSVDSTSPMAYKIASYISSNIQSGVTIDSICRHMRISQRTLFLLFQKHFGMTPNQYISREKISASIGYLNMGFTVSKVSELMNFTELSSFSRLFKKVTGHSPNAYLGSLGENSSQQTR